MTALDQSWLALAEVWIKVVRERRGEMRWQLQRRRPEHSGPYIQELKNHKVSLDRVLTIGRRAWRR